MNRISTSNTFQPLNIQEFSPKYDHSESPRKIEIQQTLQPEIDWISVQSMQKYQRGNKVSNENYRKEIVRSNKIGGLRFKRRPAQGIAQDEAGAQGLETKQENNPQTEAILLRKYNSLSSLLKQEQSTEISKQIINDRQEIKNLKHHVQNLEKVVKVLKQEIQIQCHSILFNSKKIDRINICPQMCEHQIEIKNYKQAIVIYELSIAEEKQQNRSIKEERDNLIEQLNESLKNHEKQVKVLMNEQQKVLSEKHKLEKKVRELNEAATNTQRLLYCTEIKLAQKQEQNKNNISNEKRVKEQNQKWQRQIEVLKQENLKLREKINSNCQYSEGLVDSLEIIQQELDYIRSQNDEFVRILKSKQNYIDKLSQEIGKAIQKFEESCDEIEVLRKQIVTQQILIKQHESNLIKKQKEIKFLIMKFDSCQQHKSSFQNTFLQDICSILKVPQTKNHQQLLCKLENTIEMSYQNEHIVSDYYEVLQLFGVQSYDKSCHEKLLSQICGFRTNMSVLLNKIGNLERKLIVEYQHNKYLGQKLEELDGDKRLIEMEQIISEQNEQIMRFRISACNFVFAKPSLFDI